MSFQVVSKEGGQALRNAAAPHVCVVKAFRKAYFNMQSPFAAE